MVRFIGLFVLGVVALLLSACGGGSSSAVPNNSVISGGVQKGIIIQGVISVYAVIDGVTSLTPIVTTTTDENGHYNVSLPAGFSGVVKVECSSDASTTMKCDIPTGCPGSPGASFGEALAITGFKMSAIAPHISAGSQVTINVSPMSDMATSLAESIAVGSPTGLSSDLVALSNSQTANLFGLTSLLDYETVDITDPENVLVSNDSDLRVAILSAAVAASALNQTGAIGLDAALTSLNDSFVSNSGQLIDNDTDSGLILSLQDIIEEQSTVISQMTSNATSMGVSIDLTSLELATQAEITAYNLVPTSDTETTTAQPSEDSFVGLDSLSITSGNLDQIFQPIQLSYTATVGFLAKSIKVQVTGATIKVNGVTIGSDDLSQNIALAEGVNAPIVITVTKDSVTSTYDLTVTRQTSASFAQQAYIKASNTEANDYFGVSVSLSGDTLAVSSTSEDSYATGINGDQADNTASTSGAVYIFTRSGTTWSQQAYIKASNTETGDAFGRSVSLSGDTLAVGSTYEDSYATGINGDQADNTALNSGAVYIFTRSGTTWSQQAYIKASNTEANDHFGYSVSLSGDTLAVSGVREDSNVTGINGDQADNTAIDSGAVYIFTRNATTWSQQAYIKASNTEAGDIFGLSISLSGDTLAVGSTDEASKGTGISGDQADNTAIDSGAVYIFTRNATTWSQQAYIKASNTEANDWFGISVSLSGDTLAVVALGEDSNATGINGDQADNTASKSGAVYVFTRSGTTWSQHAYIKASNAEAGDGFGRSVSLSGDTLAVGTRREDSNAIGIDGNQADNTAIDSGAVYVFTRSDTTWSQQAYIKASNTEVGDDFGYRVSLSGDTLAIGGDEEDSNATGVNGEQYDNSTTNSGAVYVFE